MAAVIEFRETTGGVGGAATATQLSGTALNNLFDNVSAAEAVAGGTYNYRAVDLYNSGDVTATAITVYLSAETTSPNTDLDFWIDPTPNSTLAAADETAPAGATWTHNLSGNKLAVADIVNLEYARLWVRRNVVAGAANLASDTATLTVEYA